MIVDIKVDYKNKKVILIHADGSVDELDARPAYFYAILPRGKAQLLERILSPEDAWIESDNKVPIIYKGSCYEPDPNYEVVKVCTWNIRSIPKIADTLRSFGIRIAASNVRYIVRQSFDYDIRYYDIIPIYYAFDSRVVDKLRRVEMLIIDIEAVEGRPVLASIYRFKPFEEIRRDDIESLWLPDEAERLQKVLNSYTIIAGHNVMGFDIPILKRAGFFIDTATKLVFDTTLVLSTYGSSLKVGSARSLLDVATILKDSAGITDEELEIKRRVKGRIDKLSREELEKYNRNDVVLTAKILNIVFPFIAFTAGSTQVPTSEVMVLPAGIVSEYYLLRLCELLGFVPEYSKTEAILEGERVWLRKERAEFKNILQTDVKMMYPTFVLKNYIDPTLFSKDTNDFDRRRGIGVIYSAVLRLAQIRQFTKKLKKVNPLYEPIDHGVKSILNALAYGVQGKKTSLALMGNPWCPSKIFYGTREAQFKTIDYLMSKGIKVVYSDTDSFYIAVECKDDEECKKKIEEIVKTINDFIAQWGLEVDVETPPGKKDVPLWDKIYIYSKKNYILKSGEAVVLKGSALHNLDRFYTPECVSIHALLRVDDKMERLKLLKEMIDSANLEDLFMRGHQQIWRLVSVDRQRYKRLDEEKKRRYMRVLTTWSEIPTLVLKKPSRGQLYLPHSNVVFALFLDGKEEIELFEYNPFNIVELRSLVLRGALRSLKVKYGLWDLLIYDDKLYTLRYEGMWYGIQIGGNMKYIPVSYEGVFPYRPIGILRTLKGRIEVRPVSVDEDILRRLVFEETKRTLRRYGLL